MSKTRRQRAQEHPGLPKKGVRDPSRKNKAAVALGRKGGKAPHIVRGMQALSPEERKAVAKTREENRKAKVS